MDNCLESIESLESLESIESIESLESLYNDIYKDWWAHQVDIGNIPERKYDTICRCHPNINKDILFTDIISSLEKSYITNKPRDNFNFIPENKDKIIWMLNRLSDIYEDTLYGYQCMDDVNNIHRIFWAKFDNIDRKIIRDFMCDNSFDIYWNDFSLIMCAVYQKSFDHVEIN
jgi:hypothetical protein